MVSFIGKCIVTIAGVKEASVLFSLNEPNVNIVGKFFACYILN